MTENFVSAADLMAQVLGAADQAYVTVPHPISSASREQLAEVARAIATDVVNALTDTAGR